MWEWGYKESWAPNNWCLWTVVLEKTLESSLDYKEIKPVHPKGNQSWIFIGRVDAETEALILWPPDVKSWLIWKDPDLGKDWRQEEKGTTENEMVGWHHQLHVHEFEQALEIGDGQGNLMCCSPWCHRVWRDWATELTYYNAILKSTTRKQCQTLQVNGQSSYKTAFASLASCILRGSSSPDLLTGSIIPSGMRIFWKNSSKCYTDCSFITKKKKYAQDGFSEVVQRFHTLSWRSQGTSPSSTSVSSPTSEFHELGI